MASPGDGAAPGEREPDEAERLIRAPSPPRLGARLLDLAVVAAMIAWGVHAHGRLQERAGGAQASARPRLGWNVPPREPASVQRRRGQCTTCTSPPPHRPHGGDRRGLADLRRRRALVRLPSSPAAQPAQGRARRSPDHLRGWAQAEGFCAWASERWPIEWGLGVRGAGPGQSSGPVGRFPARAAARQCLRQRVRSGSSARWRPRRTAAGPGSGDLPIERG